MKAWIARRVSAEHGFTLIELLVVILVIGILAAIALPMFLGKRTNAEDAGAKSDARNLMTFVDSCFVPNEDFTKCNTAAELEAPELDWGAGPGQVSVTDTTKRTYTIVAVSQSGHTFKIERGTDGSFARTCTAGADNTDGGCRNGTW